MRDQERLMREDGYVSAADAARAIGLGYIGNVHRMVRLKQVEGVQIGVHWYVLVASLLERYAGSPTIVQRILELGVKPKPSPTAPPTKPAKHWPGKAKAAKRSRRKTA